MEGRLRFSFGLRRALLVPVALVLGGLAAGLSIAAWQLADASRRADLERVADSVEQAQRLSVVQLGGKLAALQELLAEDERLATPFLRRDRDALLRASAPMFERLRSEHRITHFYFIQPDREMFLRVHHPRRFGDVVDRPSLLKAQQTGRVEMGLEMGTLGLFTLRVVRPWNYRGRLIGYLELGMEIDQVLYDAQRVLGAEIQVLVDKARLDRESWESGVRMVGRQPDWERYPDHVLVGKTDGAHDVLVDAALAGRSGQLQFIEGEPHAATRRPLRDTAGQGVGWMVVGQPQGGVVADIRRKIVLFAALCVVAGVILYHMFAGYLSHLEARLESTRYQRDRFEDASRRDGLTGLLNQRAFYAELEEAYESDMSAGRPIALLMIDIDWFKRVNDTHGHPVGDAVLQQVALKLRAHVRPGDCLARYGGEEFAVILPNADSGSAVVAAERLRQAIAARPLDTARGALEITVSVGAASSPANGNTVAALVNAADQALYAAKAAGRNRTFVFADSMAIPRADAVMAARATQA